jgi:hypothetical protein
MSGVKGFTARLLLIAGLLLACSCDSDDLAVPDSVVAYAHIQAAVIPSLVEFGNPIHVSVRVIEGCEFGEWEGVTVRFESRKIYIDTRARIFPAVPPDCVTQEANYTVTASYGGDKGSQPLPQGAWDVYVVGRNKTVTGRVTVS